MTELTWKAEKITIGELKDYPNNPRSMSKKDFEKLVRSIKEDGYHKRLLVNTDNIIIGGHSRRKALMASGFKPSDAIEVLKPSRELTSDEFQRLNIRDNIGFGDFDFDILANAFDMDELIDWGMDINLFPKIEDVTLAHIGKTEEKEKCELCGK